MDVKAYADMAAVRMKQERIPAVAAVTAIFKGQLCGRGFDEEFRRALLRELGRRGGKASAKAKKEMALADQKRLQEMISEARLLAFQRRDQLISDL